MRQEAFSFPRYQGPLNASKAIDKHRVRELAAEGLSRPEIAKTLGVSETTFRLTLADGGSVYQEWKKGASIAGTFNNRYHARTLPADEGVVLEQPDDKKVLAALKMKKYKGETLNKRKRVVTLLRITGIERGALVKSLERLVQNLKATVEEGLVYTEYEACDE